MAKLTKVLIGIVLAPIALLVIGIGGCETTKAYYDWQVSKICARDGGVTVYERMAISPEMFKSLKGDLGGGLAIPHESKSDTAIPVYWRSNVNNIRSGYPAVTRTEIVILRRADGRILGKDVQYARTGGDFPFTASAPSEFVCPKLDVEALLSKKVFYVEGASK